MAICSLTFSGDTDVKPYLISIGKIVENYIDNHNIVSAQFVACMAVHDMNCETFLLPFTVDLCRARSDIRNFWMEKMCRFGWLMILSKKKLMTSDR